MQPELYIGTAGWSYKDWVGSFYEAEQSKNYDWLQFYSDYFNCIEVNSSYYVYINPNTIDGWIEKVEHKDDFLFTVKLHQDFTHKKNFNSNQERAVKLALDKLSASERFGGLLIQFPYSFQATEANIQYLGRLVKLFDEYDKFVEVRHSSWNEKRAKQITFCTIDQPSIGESIEFKPKITNGKLYVRLHGRNKEAWLNSIKNFGKKQTYDEQNARYNYLYSPGEIIDIAMTVREVFESVRKVFLILNNHPNGNAVANAFELMNALLKKQISIPQTTLQTFPRLSRLGK